MNTEQIKGLDREKTVVILPDGILEEHGPYLPSFSDRQPQDGAGDWRHDPARGAQAGGPGHTMRGISHWLDNRRDRAAEQPPA